jgi:hypothetical protein
LRETVAVDELRQLADVDPPVRVDANS